MELAIHGAKKKLTVSDKSFDRPFSEALVHQVVTAYLAGGRAGTKAQKTRSQVSGGGRKPWRQKGTGQARAGTIRSPIWRSGGVTFAATPRDHSQKVNRKMYRGALQAIFSELVRQDRLVVVNDLKVDAPRTKDFVKLAEGLDLTAGLVITADLDGDLYLAARNVPRVHVIDVAAIDPVSLVGAEKVVMTVAAVEKVQEWLG